MIKVSTGDSETPTVKCIGSVFVNSGQTSYGVSGFVTMPSVDISFPVNHFKLDPNENSRFTKEMIDDSIESGENYIVFESESIDVRYEDSEEVVGGWSTYLDVNIKATEESPITLDFRSALINCYPNSLDNTKSHRFLSIKNSENLNIKFADAEGDKFKRPLLDNSETSLENTVLFTVGSGSKNIVIDGGDLSGFMADVGNSSQYGEAAIDTDPLSNFYEHKGGGVYESGFYEINTDEYSEFGLTGGLGYNRLLYYNMDDVVFKFYDSNNVKIIEITEAKYLERYSFPNTPGIAKMKVEVIATDGRIEDFTNFGHRLEYNPTYGTILRNLRISDNHRGGIANIGSNSTIDNCTFFNTQRYFDSPKFGVNGNTNSTTYHVNCEDVVSRNLKINNCHFYDKFHKILFTHNLSVEITECVFDGYGYNIFCYDLIEGVFSRNTFYSDGQVNGGIGTNKGLVEISNNTGNPSVKLSQGANWINNNFNNCSLSGKGKMSGNTFTNSDYSYLEWTKEMKDNIFTGNNGGVQYVSVGTYNYLNHFINTGFRFQHGDSNDKIIFDNVIIDNELNPLNDSLYRYNSPVNIIVINSTLKDSKIYHRISGQPVSYNEGYWFFDNCDFNNITNYIIKLSVSEGNESSVKFYFRNCTFSGSGDFINLSNNNIYYEVFFENCVIDPMINMPNTYEEQQIPNVAITEPRTMPEPNLTNRGDYIEVSSIFHIFTLIIRDKVSKDIVFSGDVNKGYRHYTENVNGFEYSIDGGLYWDSVL